LPLLAWHPGRLTRRYIDGERAKFVSPMALFLFSVFLMFAVVSNIAAGGHQPSVGLLTSLAQDNNQLAELKAQRVRTVNASERQALDDRIDALNDKIDAMREAVRSGGGAEQVKTGDLKPVHLDTGWAWIDNGAAHMSANPDLTLYKVKTYGYKYGWALIPISLPFIWLLFAFRRDVGPYDHAIFSIYSLSFMSLGVVALTLLGWIGLPSALIALAAIFIPPFHMYRQLKGTYGLGRFGAGWRTFALLIETAITSSLFIAFLFYMGSG
ncbi:MAG TPA: DUF3667 domain-containing protein, partial [Sphingomonas sp.]|nr:DUF3667 domain-containing protein [Sphingomonas sp.]